jgi:inosine-uridine nucleoside N-ribohydrolase
MNGLEQRGLPALLWIVVLLSIIACASARTAAAATPEPIIIDTDIGTDIDDAFAVALALRSPEVKILGISTASGDTKARAKILDRMLGVSGHQDIPVAVGVPTMLPNGTPSIGRQSRFGAAGGFERSSHPSAVDFILEETRHFPGQITLVPIGPLTNLAGAIEKDPATFRKLKRIVMMAGSIGPADLGGWGMASKPAPEYNIQMDIPAAQKVFASGVPIYVMPLDSTANLKLDEVKRDVLLSNGTPLTDALALLYVMWGSVTPVLFDAMAVAFVIDPKQCPVEPLRILVDDQGVTRTEPGEPNAQVCMHSDPEVFFRLYMSRFQ